jgi:hypothetical protein
LRLQTAPVSTAPVHGFVCRQWRRWAVARSSGGPRRAITFPFRRRAVDLLFRTNERDHGDRTDAPDHGQNGPGTLSICRWRRGVRLTERTIRVRSARYTCAEVYRGNGFGR